MRRAFHIALVAAASAAAPEAGAQFRSTPMILYAPDYGADVLPYAFDATAPASDLLALYASPTVSSAPFRRHHDVIQRLPSPVAQPSTLYDCVAAGRLAQNGSDALTDVAYCLGTGSLQIAFGNARAVLQAYPIDLNPYTRGGPAITFAHLLPRDSDVIVFPYLTGVGIDIGYLYAVDFDSAGAQSPTTGWESTNRLARSVPEQVLTMRISDAARARGIDDLYLPGRGSVQLFENRTQAGATALGQVELRVPPILMGTDKTGTSAFLPPGVPNADCQGAAPLDVDFDGKLDVVLSLSNLSRYGTLPAGHLLWIRGTGTLTDLASAPWAELGSHPDLGLVDPVVVRQLLLGGEPAVAVWDRGLDEVLVIRSDAAGRRLVVWRGSTAGRHVRDIRLADVVGSTAPDLVVDGTGFIEFDHPPVDFDPAILVYPDVGDASPVLAWAPGSPGAPERGEDHSMAVAASDADAAPGSLRIDWIVGDPWFDPVAGTGSSYVHPGADLCGTPPQTLPVTVRAVDEWGVYAEIGATLDVAEAPPRIGIRGAEPPGRLALPPGGTAAAFEGSAWTQCPGTSLQLTTSPPWPAGATVQTPVAGAGRIVQEVVLPESAYEALLASAEERAVQLTATDGALTAATTLLLYVDASGLVGLAHESDLASIAEGEVAMLETRITSRLGVALQSVHVVHALAGLAAAGEPEAEGATVVETRAGGTEVVLDVLPPAGAEVVVHLPVRSAGGRAASAVEVRSSGGHLLTPPAAVPVEVAPAPGCGCGSSPAGSALALAALAALRRRRLT